MSEKHQLPSESDDDDEDYIPAEHDSVSEMESEEEAEISVNCDNNHENQKDNLDSEIRKRCKKIKQKVTKRKRNQMKSNSCKKVVKEECVEDINKASLLGQEEEKKRADSLWADFMKDAAVVSKSKSGHSTATISSEKLESSLEKPEVEDKIKIKKVFDFAGEKIEIEKEVLADSTEARLSLNPRSENVAKNFNNALAHEKQEPKDRQIRKVGLGGISSVLGHLGKKAKITTLEKSKMDWDNFKKEENLVEEINTHNKGKDGYLEKQDFLQRADFRQFEIEKQLRNTSRRSSR